MFIKRIKDKYFIVFVFLLILLFIILFSDLIIQTITGLKVAYYFNKNRLDLTLFYLNIINKDLFLFVNQKYELLMDKLLIFLLIKDYKSAKLLIDRLSNEFSKFNKNLKIYFLIYKGLYFMSLHELKNAFEMYKSVLLLDPDNKKAKIYIETLFKIKNNIKTELKTSKNNNNEKKIKNLIIEKIINSNEIKGFQNYKKYINKKNENEDKYYW